MKKKLLIFLRTAISFNFYLLIFIVFSSVKELHFLGVQPMTLLLIAKRHSREVGNALIKPTSARTGLNSFRIDENEIISFFFLTLGQKQLEFTQIIFENEKNKPFSNINNNGKKINKMLKQNIERKKRK